MSPVDVSAARASLASKAYYKANRERIIERAKNYYTANRMERLAYQVKYSEEHATKIAEYQRDYWQKTKPPAAPPKPKKERVSKKRDILPDGTQDLKPKSISYKPRHSPTPISITEGPVWLHF